MIPNANQIGKVIYYVGDCAVPNSCRMELRVQEVLTQCYNCGAPPRVSDRLCRYCGVESGAIRHA